MKPSPCHRAEDLWAPGNKNACLRCSVREQLCAAVLGAIAKGCGVGDGPGREEVCSSTFLKVCQMNK